MAPFNFSFNRFLNDTDENLKRVYKLNQREIDTIRKRSRGCLRVRRNLAQKEIDAQPFAISCFLESIGETRLTLIMEGAKKNYTTRKREPVEKKTETPRAKKKVETPSDKKNVETPSDKKNVENIVEIPPPPQQPFTHNLPYNHQHQQFQWPYYQPYHPYQYPTGMIRPELALDYEKKIQAAVEKKWTEILKTHEENRKAAEEKLHNRKEQ